MSASTSPDPHLPWEDDEERPGLSIRPLSHADLAALLAHWDHDDADEEPPQRQAAAPRSSGPQPSLQPPASSARATVGRAGTSAMAEYRRRCDTELAAWMRTLPLRLVATLAAGVAAWLLGHGLLGMPLGLLVGLAAAAVAGWRLRFRPSADTLAWRHGAHGERRTARLLDRLQPHGWVVLHDLAVPGSRANLDHLLIGPGGVFVVDSKQYSGRLQLGADGTLWHGRYPLTLTLRAVRFEADRATAMLGMPAVEAIPIVAVHGAPVPWGSLQVDQVTVVAADRLTDLLRARPSCTPTRSPGSPSGHASGFAPPPDHPTRQAARAGGHQRSTDGTSAGRPLAGSGAGLAATPTVGVGRRRGPGGSVGHRVEHDPQAAGVAGLVGVDPQPMPARRQVDLDDVADDQAADLDPLAGAQQLPGKQQRPGWRRGGGADPHLELDRVQVVAGGHQDGLLAGDQGLLAGLPAGSVGGVVVDDRHLVVQRVDLDAVDESPTGHLTTTTKASPSPIRFLV
jgi:hypothetical protein